MKKAKLLCLLVFFAVAAGLPFEACAEEPAVSGVDSAVKKETPPEKTVSGTSPVETTASDETVKTDANGKKLVPVEINGDQVEFVMQENKVVATGHVSITQGLTKLTCDKAQFWKDEQRVDAEGHVVLSTPSGRIMSDKLNYNFKEMKGGFVGANIFAYPYYGTGESIGKVGENHIVMEKGYLTTCDLTKPHFRLTANKIDVYPGDKAVAENLKFVVGKMPLMYLPHFTQNIKDKKPSFIITPGYDKDWGAFFLAQWRYYFNEGLKGVVHLDARERKGGAYGVDVNYAPKNMGSGKIRTYFTDEFNLASKHWLEDHPDPIEHKRFMVEWRHKWDVDKDTNMVLQYVRLSDSGILKDYFRRQYQKDSTPPTFFVLTRTLPSGTLSLRADKQVNRFVATTQRLPEIQYALTNQRLGPTNFYLKSTNTYSNLLKRDASPSEVRQETMRVDTDNELAYPFKLAFLEFKPFVGGRGTYYSKTKDPAQYEIMRGLFKTGADISTKFYRIYDVKTNWLNLDVNRLRHIITPSVSYRYNPRPTFVSSILDIYDSGIDSVDRNHTVGLSLENKLQTKRDGLNVDLLRSIVSSDFHLDDSAGKGSFDHVKTDHEFRPTKWLTFYADTDYDTYNDHLTTANFDLYVNNEDKWSFDFGKRYAREVDDQITTQLMYKINPLWKFRAYGRFDIDHGILKEQEFTVTRDLHCWEMDISFNETRGEGNEIWVIFRLKAFPEIGFDFQTSYNRRKAGSQSTGQ